MYKTNEYDEIISRDNTPITAKFITDKIDETVRLFGTQFNDVDEVMDIPPIVEEIVKLPATDAGLLLMQVAAYDKKNGIGEVVAEYILSSIDVSESGWFEEVVKISGVNY